MTNRVHKNKIHYGLTDYRKFYNKQYNQDIDKDTYRNIVEDFNKGVVDLIINEGIAYTLPYIYMEITVRKEKRVPKIKDGKLVNRNPVDYKSTKELWAKDEDAAKKKLVVRYNNRHTFGYVFTIYLKKFKCKLKCRSYYKIKPNRKFQRGLAKRINDPDKEAFDAFLLYDPNIKKK